MSVDPGPQTPISSISLSFHGPVLTEDPAQENAARFAFSLHEGDPFSQSGWDDAKSAALKALQSRRYLGAKIYAVSRRVSTRARTRRNCPSLIDSGPTFTMGKLDVSGTRRYPEQIVDNVNPISVGAIYDVQRVAELQRQLQNTPYYASVAIDVGNDPAKPLETPVQVKVQRISVQQHPRRGGLFDGQRAAGAGQLLVSGHFRQGVAVHSGGRIDQIQQYGQIQLVHAAGPSARGPIACWRPTPPPTYPTHASTVFAAACKRTRTSQFIDYGYSLLYYHDRLDQNAVAPTTAARWCRVVLDAPQYRRPAVPALRQPDPRRSGFRGQGRR